MLQILYLLRCSFRHLKMTKDNMPDRMWKTRAMIMLSHHRSKAYSAYSGIDCNSVHDLATSTDIDFRISLPNRVHSHRHPRMRSARNLFRQLDFQERELTTLQLKITQL